MAEPVCAYCDKSILPGEDQVTVRTTPYHAECWNQKARERWTAKITVAAALGGLPLRTLCLDCLVNLTGLRAAAVNGDLERLGGGVIEPLVAECDRCHTSGPAFRSTNAR